MAHSRSVSKVLALLPFATAIASVSPVYAQPAQPAPAQPTGQDVATSQALFDEGKRLMDAGKLDEGCPKLVESQRLDPAGGTLLAIALCHEAQGKTATAWAEFGIALGEARKDRRSDREATAQQHIKTLEPKLTKVRMVVTGKVEGLEIRRDGGRVGEAQWTTPLPVDPGDHSFEARAPGKVTWSKVVPVKGEGAIVDVTIPALDDEAVVAPAGAGKPAGGASAGAGTGSARDLSGDRATRLTWAAIVGGVGLVATGAGIVFGASASSKWSEADKACPNRKCMSDADVAKGKDAGSAADLSTLFFIVGGAGLVTSTVLWLTAPNASNTTNPRGVHLAPVVTGQSGGLVLGGAL